MCFRKDRRLDWDYQRVAKEDQRRRSQNHWSEEQVQQRKQSQSNQRLGFYHSTAKLNRRTATCYETGFQCEWVQPQTVWTWKVINLFINHKSLHFEWKILSETVWWTERLYGNNKSNESNNQEWKSKTIKSKEHKI